ncbi:MAG: lipase family protein [Deltaproteobacteria bacterium]|nr:lipase family protein [Deltaproteobacteria bacterium]
MEENIEGNKKLALGARLASLSYDTEDLIVEKIGELTEKETVVDFIRSDKLFGFVARYSDIAFIVFRGTTKSVDEWLNNLDFRLIMTEYGGIHKGFAESLDSISNYHLSQIIKLFDKPYKIHIAGHSRGGALATLTAAVLMKNNIKPSGIYTYGSPKVGDKTFADWYDSRLKEVTIRVVNRNDPIPHLPPSFNFDDISYWSITLFFFILKIIMIPYYIAKNVYRRFRTK